MANTIVFPGIVEWSGENPGISLKEREDGPFIALASFFRVVLSPHGRGHALVLLRAPQTARPIDGEANLCLTDNITLAHFLVENFVARFGAFRDLPGLEGLQYQRLDQVEATGDPHSAYSETVTAGTLRVQLRWTGLGEPFCFALPPDQSATGRHHMPSLFVPCLDGAIEVNGVRLPGKPVPREVAGHPMSTAMLAFSETWIRA